MAGNTCENCHGPGSTHATIALKFAEKKTLSADEQREVKAAIWRVNSDNVCAKCHMAMAHKAHEQYDKP